LPYSGFRWLDENEINQFDINNIPNGKGYLIYSDLEYPE